MELTRALASITPHAPYSDHQVYVAVTGAGGPEDGQALPSGVLPAATFMISGDEWILLAPPAGAHPGMLRRTALAWLDSAPPSSGGSVAFVPVPSIDPVLGRAVLHHRLGGTIIYCQEADLGQAAAEMLSLIASTTMPILIANAAQHEPPRATVAAVSHDRWLDPTRDRWLHPSLHPVVAHVALPQAAIFACDCQVTFALADVLTTLGGEQLRLLHARRAGLPGRCGWRRYLPCPGGGPKTSGCGRCRSIATLMETKELNR